MATILDEYIQKHPGSASRYEEARDIFPAGVTHDTRYVTPFPIYVTHGEGPVKWDVDGNEYVDYVCGHGALILGHSHPEIVAAVAGQVAKGTHLGANTEQEIRWGRAIKRLVPSVEKVRFHSSGTEATLMAMRLARAYTGRDVVVKFEDHFHGWHDYSVAVPDRRLPGVPDATSRSVRVLPPGDISAVEQMLARDGDVAAVIVEPTGAHMGQFPLVVPQFLRGPEGRHQKTSSLAHYGRGGNRLPGGSRGGPGTVRHRPRPDHHGQDRCWWPPRWRRGW